MPDLVDIDLDALAAPPKRAKLGGKVYKLPGDMPLELFFRVQSFEQRVENGENEVTVLSEIRDELLGLFQVYQPTMKKLPPMGVLELAQALPRIYAGGAVGEPPPNRETRRQRKRTPSKTSPQTRRPTSR